MVPREAGRGASFKGAGLYYLHDRGADTSERVTFTHTENIPTNDPQKALKWMAWTAMNAEELKREAGVPNSGRASARPVYTFALSWHPEEEPKKWDMIGAGRRALAALGLQEHETLMVSHNDRPHPHLHLIVNTIHPETGRVNSISYSKLKLSKWAEEYEREHKIYCEQRIENNARREQGEKVKYREPELDLKGQITKLYRQSDSGEAFRAALEQQGFTLAQGKRIVLIDREGEIHSLYRQIEGAKAKEIKERLAGLELPDVDDARSRIGEASEGKQQQAEKQVAQNAKQQSEREERETNQEDEQAEEPVYFDRDEQDRQWQESIIDAGIDAERVRRPLPELPQTRAPASRPFAGPLEINAVQDRHHAELGRFYAENTHARLKLDSQLDAQYGEHERQLRSDIDHLDALLSNSGFLRRCWLQFTGQIPRHAEEELLNMRLTLENIEWRKEEAYQGLDARVEAERREIEHRHVLERKEMQPPNAAPIETEAIYPEPTHDSVQTQGDFDSGPEPEEDSGPSFEY